MTLRAQEFWFGTRGIYGAMSRFFGERIIMTAINLAQVHKNFALL
jgi:hypothetical protein